MIYLLEDDSNIRKLIVYTLRSGGMEAEGFAAPSQFYEAVKKQFRPEFINRIDEIIVFSALNEDAIRKVISLGGDADTMGAITGAILGAKLVEAALPEFYLDGLDAAAPLRQLAKDLVQAGSGHKLQIFDDDWDKKYIQGEPVEETGWAEA